LDREDPESRLELAGIPSRVAEARRDLGAMATALGVVGGGGSPNEMRSDAGIMLGMGVEETLKRHVDLLTWEQVFATCTVPALNTTTIGSAISFPEDVYILNLSMWSESNPANFVWGAFMMRDPASTNSNLIYFGEAADLRTLVAGEIDFIIAGAQGILVPATQAPLPLFVRQGIDFRIKCRSGGGGGTVVFMMLTVARCPKGVEIPH